MMVSGVGRLGGQAPGIVPKGESVTQCGAGTKESYRNVLFTPQNRSHKVDRDADEFNLSLSRKHNTLKGVFLKTCVRRSYLVTVKRLLLKSFQLEKGQKAVKLVNTVLYNISY